MFARRGTRSRPWDLAVVRSSLRNDLLSGGELKAALITALVAALFAVSGCGSVDPDTSSSPPAATVSPPPPPPPPPSEHFTRANWDVLATDPESHKGATVDIVGRVWSATERDEGTLRFAMYADPKNSEWDILVEFPDSSARIASDDYVRVKGSVRDAYTRENALGAEITVPLILADSVSRVDAPQAESP
jgi:hypothetical protein